MLGFLVLAITSGSNFMLKETHPKEKVETGMLLTSQIARQGNFRPSIMPI